MPERIPDSFAYPPRGMSHEEAARYVGVDRTTFDRLVADERMPKPKRASSHLIWDRFELDNAFGKLDKEVKNAAGTISDEKRILQIARRAIQRYDATPPRPTQVTQKQAADILGVSTKTIRNYIRSGLLKLNRCGRLPIEAIDDIKAR